MRGSVRERERCASIACMQFEGGILKRCSFETAIPEGL